MKIYPLELIDVPSGVRIQSLIEYGRKQNYLWYEIDKRYERYITTEKLDGFLVGVLLLAMKHGEDIYVDGAISEKLLYNISSYYMKILTIIMPDLHMIAIHPKELDFGLSYACEGAVATGFSAGIDSFCTVLDHYITPPPPSYKLTHLIFNNVGSHGEFEPEKVRRIFNAHFDRVKKCSDELGLDLIKIDSNLSDVLQMKFVLTHTPRNISAVLILQRLFRKLYCSSGQTYQDCKIDPAKVMGFTDPSAIHLLSTETLECISAGCQYSRTEKTEKVAQVEHSFQYLNVCVALEADGRNCSLCWKCCQTILSLEILGKAEKYVHVFDMEKYMNIKNFYICSILSKRGEHYNKEVIELSEREHYIFPLWCHVVACFLKIVPKWCLEKLMGVLRLYFSKFPHNSALKSKV